MSLDSLAKLSSVSKSMLGQIERGEVSPTISTLWKIANGLKISFTELVIRPEKDYEVIAAASVEPLVEDNGRSRNYPIFAFDSARRFEMYYLELDDGARIDAEPHPTGTQEFITVFSGSLQISVGDELLKVGNSCSVRFRADRPHAYQNVGADICRLSMVIYYPQLA